MRSNSSGVCSRLCAVIAAVKPCPGTAGVPPSCPAETCAFCACSATRTSAGVRRYLVSFDGSSQMRIAYCPPKICTSPTPVTRDSGSWMFDTR